MTTLVDIANQALASIGNRSTIASLVENSNEAIQANMIINNTILELLRMAPWNCAFNYATLIYITATGGTPENPSVVQTMWNKTFPAPPWTYEYQYPSDCLRPCWIVPQYVTGFAQGIPITTAMTGGVPNYWSGPPSKFKVAIDQPITATAVAIASGGSGYAVGDSINLTGGAGVPTVLQVTAVGGGGTVTGVSIFLSGSYSTSPTNPVAQGASSGGGTGATFNLTLSSAVDRKVILSNQEFAILAYIRNTVAAEPDIWDSQLTEAVIHRLGARLVYALTGDKALANERTKHANDLIIAARNSDGNEGITINDVTPDWIRGRGILYPNDMSWSPNMGYDWGNLIAVY